MTEQHGLQYEPSETKLAWAPASTSSTKKRLQQARTFNLACSHDRLASLASPIHCGSEPRCKSSKTSAWREWCCCLAIAPPGKTEYTDQFTGLVTLDTSSASNWKNISTIIQTSPPTTCSRSCCSGESPTSQSTLHQSKLLLLHVDWVWLEHLRAQGLGRLDVIPKSHRYWFTIRARLLSKTTPRSEDLL